MNVIKDWIVKQDYAVGIALYRKLPGCDQAYMSFLTSDTEHPTMEMRSLLERELLRVSDRLSYTNPELLSMELPVTEATTVATPPSITIPDAGKLLKVIRGTIRPEEMPDDIRAIYNQNGEIATTIKELKRRVHDKETPEDEAKKALNLLIEAEDRYNEGWDRIDQWYLTANQHSPDIEKQQAAIRAIKLHKEKGNLENYIRKFAKDPDKVSEYRARLETVKKELDEATGGATP